MWNPHLSLFKRSFHQLHFFIVNQIQTVQPWDPPTLPIHPTTQKSIKAQNTYSSVLITTHWIHDPVPPQKPEQKTQRRPAHTRVEPKQSLVGADCHVPKVTSWPNSTSHSFLGGGARPPGRGASLQCRPAWCHADTVCLSCLLQQPSVLSHIFSTGRLLYVEPQSKHYCVWHLTMLRRIFLVGKKLIKNKSNINICAQIDF